MSSLNPMICLATRSSRMRRTSAWLCPPSAATAAGVNELPYTAASWSTERSEAVSPSSRAAASACSVSGTSSSPMSAVTT